MAAAQSISELAEMVRRAAESAVPVYPKAGGTQEQLLAPVPADAKKTVLDLSGLNQVVDYPYRDLTITVQAGVTLATLEQMLAEHGQTLPIDVPLAHQATVGGAIAANINGPRRTGWGTWRDYVIGISFINDRGEEAKAGGRVVKNVAGYDLCKLMTGSFGTLGVITQVTLKVRPRPERLALLAQRVQREQFIQVSELLRGSRVRARVQVLSAESGSDYRLELGFEDGAAAVEWQLRHWQEECGSLAERITSLEGREAERRLALLTAFPLEGPTVTFQASVLSSQVAGFLALAGEHATKLQAYPADGIVVGHLPADVSLEQAEVILTALRGEAEASGGHVTLRRCPAAWRTRLLPWGPPRPEWGMMRKIKAALDPKDLFQRGRYEPLFSTLPAS